MPFLRGAFLGVLTEMRRMKPEDLAAELAAYARGAAEQQVVAGDFLHGVLAGIQNCDTARRDITGGSG